MEVKQWIDADTQNNMDVDGHSAHSKPQLVENEWARVWGRLKSFSNKRHVGAHVIRPISDKMDIMYHLLEATYVHLYFARGPLDQVKQEPSTAANGVAGHGQDAGYGDSGANSSRALQSVSMNARKVHQALATSPQNNEGLHVQNIATIAGMNYNDVMKAGEELLSHSLIFTTVDDNTWALLDF